MAVEDFIPLGDVKQTVEKEVPRKPSIEELTTVEKPGKPGPASMLENGSTRKKKRVRRKKEKAEPSTILAAKRDGVLIITEKPQAAAKIADALGEARSYKENGVAYYEVERGGKNIVVASAVGHLYGLTYAKGQKGWPIYELVWQPSFERKGGEFTKRYYDLLRKLAARAKEFFVATDFDTEGEVIGWNVLRFICKQQSAKRMKYSTLTATELAKAYDAPLGELAWGNAYAGEARHFIDWLYGINLSRALMAAIKRTGSFKILSIGRVQGPALKIIVDREREILSFKPEPFWRIFAYVGDIEFVHPEDIFDKKDLERFEGIQEAEATTKKAEEHVRPGVPFDLTTLQREAYRVHGISPSETLKIAQKLYLDGLISYPRTSSQKIPNEIEPRKILAALANQYPEAKHATRAAPIEGAKSDPAHPSIYPTGMYKKLEERAEKLYTLIVKRFIACFYADAKIATKKITLRAHSAHGEVIFTASGLEVLEKGWTSFYPYRFEEANLPDMNGRVHIDRIDIQQKETQAPHRYTPASLVSILEKKNLGTKATRSMIVETLFERGYLDGKSISATPLGMKLIDALERHSPIIIDEQLTRLLEEEMEALQLGEGNLEAKEKEIIEKVKRVIGDISKEFKAKEAEIGTLLLSAITQIREQEQQSNILMRCPTCGKGDLRILYSKKSRRYFVACSAYPACTQTFSLPPNALIKKSGSDCPADHFPKLLAIRKGKRPWEFCFNQNCPIEKEKREQWAAKKAGLSASET